MENSDKNQLSSLPDDFLIKMKMENTEDQLSSLSDDILIKILSLLPIQTAVATSVLSRRWIDLWTHITAFRLHETIRYYDEESGTTIYTPSNLTSIVDHLLPKLNSPVISTFTLVADDNKNINPDSINSWIQLICARNVQYCELSYRNNDAFISPSTACLFQCRSLVSLSLSVCLSTQQSLSFEEIEVDLPNLKILVIGLQDFDETLMAKLFKSCPRLEALRISGFFYLPGLVDTHTLETREVPVFISAQYLRSLYIHFDHFDVYDNIVVYLDAPNLQLFQVDDYSCVQFKLINQPTALLKAKLDCMVYDTMNRVYIDVFQLISGVSHLEIGEGALQNALDHQLPVFSNLTKLVSSVSTIGIWKTDYFRLLDCTPNLEFLDIDLQFSCRVIDDVNDPTTLFPQDLSAPSCLVHCVKKMEFQITGVQGLRYQELELEVVKYMLIHTTALEELVIKVRCVGIKKAELLQQHEELELYHLYENLRDLPRSLGVHCSFTLKFVLYYGIQLVFPHQMEFEDGRVNSSSSFNPEYCPLAPTITLKESFST